MSISFCLLDKFFQKSIIFLYFFIEKTEMYKMYKNVKNCIFLEQRVIQVFHIKNTEKGGKIGIFKKFSTLSTLKHVFCVDYSGVKNERTFCELVMKITFCRKRLEKMLTFE